MGKKIPCLGSLKRRPSLLVKPLVWLALANEPDTNSWYREALKAAALPMIARLAPVVAVLCDRPETANEPHKWEPIAEGGTPALRA